MSRKKERIIRICQECGKEFKVQPYRVRKGEGKFCSRKCKDQNNNTGIIEKTCQHCGIIFTISKVRSDQGRGQFCSRECRFNSRRKIQTCQYCGKQFKMSISQVKAGRGKYCSKKCSIEGQKKKIKKICITCGKEFFTNPAEDNRRGGVKYCSTKCYHKNNVGENNPQWKGGISFEPYCILFNDEFKERCREWWDRKCGICGVNEIDNEIKLSVHHVNYDKQTCCNTTIPLFIPICRKCHPKTNSNREYWEENLSNYIMIWFNGECYNPKEVNQMPLPAPNKNESQSSFVSRCMGNPTMLTEYKDQKQRAAVCISIFQRRNKKK